LLQSRPGQLQAPLGQMEAACDLSHLQIAPDSLPPQEKLEDMSYGGRRGGSGGFGGRSFGQGPSGPKPVEVGKEYDVEITEISRRGDGIAKIGGFVIFVEGAKAGSKVKIKVTSVGPRFASASIVS